MKRFDDYLRTARRRLPHFLFEYLDGGSYDETTLRANRSSLAEVALRQRVLRNVLDVDSGIDLFGTRRALPIVLGPVGLAGMMARRGEVSAARARPSGSASPIACPTMPSVRWPKWRRRRPIRFGCSSTS